MKNCLKGLIAVCLCGVLISNVKAEEVEYIKTVDNDGYSISVDVNESQLNMTLNGMEEAYSNDATSWYYVKFVNEDDEMPRLEVNEDYYGCQIISGEVGSGIGEWNMVHKDDLYIDINSDWYMLSGYNYAYIVKTYLKDSSNFCEIIKEPIKVNRPDLPKLGERYSISFFNDAQDDSNEQIKNPMFIFQNFPFSGEMGSHTLNVKVGVINDNDVLSKLANNASDSLTILMEYARNNDGKIYHIADNVWMFENNGLNIIPNAYYYVYTTYENEDGLYRDLSDIVVVQANELGTHLSNNVWWNQQEISYNWDQLVAKMTSNDEKSLSKLYNLNVEANDNVLKVSTQKDDKTYTMTYTYENGIVSASADTEETYYFLGNLTNSYLLNYISEILNYDTEDFRNWINEVDNNHLSVKVDGIEYKDKMYKNNSGQNIEYYSDLKIDVDNGISKYVIDRNIIVDSSEKNINIEETVENPNTGIYISICGIVAIIVAGFYIFLRNKNYFSKI